VHWDHIGEPRDFPTSTFIVGHGSLALLAGTSAGYRGGHSFFEADLLPPERSVELADPLSDQPHTRDPKSKPGDPDFSTPWRRYRPCALPSVLPCTLDIFGDGSVLIVDAPGHLPGHINLLARTSKQHYMYLGGDTCHDRRLLTGEKQIGEWTDAEGHVCCIHVDREAAEETIRRIRQLEEKGAEIVFAHDVEWENDAINKGRFFGAG
jgi:glyoxylase-like metal-dependent hydrolase (beta-lactamase superfamily II)